MLGGISRLSFHTNAASLAQIDMMRAIDAIGALVLGRCIKKTSLTREALRSCPQARRLVGGSFTNIVEGYFRALRPYGVFGSWSY